MIYILTGNVRTGKTSALLNWIKNRGDVDGVLCPDNENGKRYFLNIRSEETYILELEAQTECDNIVSIGPFQFLKSAFQKANNYLIHSAQGKNCSYHIIDELGKLELKNEGLHEAAQSIIPQYQFNLHQHLIIIVRESLLSTIIAHYNISQYSVLKKEDLQKLK